MEIRNNNQLAFTSTIGIKGLDFKDPKIGDKKLWKGIQKSYKTDTKDKDDVFELKSDHDHRGMPIIKIYKVENNGEQYVGGFDGIEYRHLADSSAQNIVNKLVAKTYPQQDKK